MRLIINADDFGLSKGQNYGIIDCFTQGVVTATTLLTTTAGFEHACQLASQQKALDIGIHLSLDLGKPVSKPDEISSLIENQHFRKYSLEDTDISVNPDEVYREWHNQIEKALASGIQPTHLDSHHHIHMMQSVFPIFIRLAQEYNLAIRFHPRKWTEEQIAEQAELLKTVKSPDRFVNQFYNETIQPEFFKDVAFQDAETLEMMCHPAYLDDWIQQNSSYNLQRVTECATLQNPLSRDYLEKRNVQLISFKDL